MRRVLFATLLVILVTLECHGDPDVQFESSGATRPRNSTSTRPSQPQDLFVLSYPLQRSDQSYPTRGSQNQTAPSRGSQAPSSPPRGSQAQNSPPRSSQDQNTTPRGSQAQNSPPRSSQDQNTTPRGSQAQNPPPRVPQTQSQPDLLIGQPQSNPVPTDVGVQNQNETVPDTAQVINAQLRQFGLNLLIQLSELEPTANLVLSPFSVWAVLLMILEGARGTTATQIRNTLHLPNDTGKIRSNYKFIEGGLTSAKGSADFTSVNGLFYDVNRPLKQDFQHIAEISYHAELHGIDYTKPKQSVKEINDWVANKTRNRITHLVHEDDVSQPQLLVANAIYFRGMWETPFNHTATNKAKFYNEQNVHIETVDMMYQKAVYLFSYIKEIKAQVLDMPYKDGNFRMLVVLPQSGNTLLNVYRAMKSFPVDECYKRLLQEQEQYSESEVPVYLPRFRIKNDLTLNVLLENLGITDVFQADTANLSGLSRTNLYLNRMIHISEIEVNEEGTIASASTGAMFVNKQSPPKFVANRPFAFFIVENDRKTVIFAGRVLNPNKIQ